MPVVAYGTGTCLEGNVIPHLGGVVVDLANMDQVLRVSAEDLDCTVQARVTRKQLNEYIRDQGLFFPIDPGADASLGGMAATRASAASISASSCSAVFARTSGPCSFEQNVHTPGHPRLPVK